MVEDFPHPWESTISTDSVDKIDWALVRRLCAGSIPSALLQRPANLALVPTGLALVPTGLAPAPTGRALLRPLS